MRIVIAPDKFKGSLTAIEAAEAMARGVRRAMPNADVDLAPMADGGEGTVDALVAATGGTYREAIVNGPFDPWRDPDWLLARLDAGSGPETIEVLHGCIATDSTLGCPITARFGLSGDGRTAFVEMAAAAGLGLVAPEHRDPSRTTTHGVGGLLVEAAFAGVRRIVLGIGGSATNDGGAGMADALGFGFLDDRGFRLHPVGGDLDQIAQIEPPAGPHPLDNIDVEVACDVDNPLCGPRGASAVYGPQKGATPEMVERLDRNLAHLARLIRRDLGIDVADVPGAGAAGGLGAGLIAFARGRLRRGAELVIEAVDLPRRLAAADLCLTGEGSIDRSTGHGKVVAGVGLACREVDVPCLALAGTLGEGAGVVLERGVSAMFSLCGRPLSLEEAVAESASLLEAVAEQAVRAFVAGRAKRGEAGT